MAKKLKTHIVLDLIYTPEEGQECFDGTLEECNEFVAEQTKNSVNTYKVVPMTKEEVENHPANKMEAFSLQETWDGGSEAYRLQALIETKLPKHLITYSWDELTPSQKEQLINYFKSE